MDRKAVVFLRFLQTGCFVLFQLFRPINDNLFKLGSSQVTEGRVLAVRSVLWDGFLETITKSLAQIREF
jgi:hypothetical protein